MSELSTRVNENTFNQLRYCIFNMTNGQLSTSGVMGADFYYTINLERKDGRKPTKEQIKWAETVVLTTQYYFQ